MGRREKTLLAIELPLPQLRFTRIGWQGVPIKAGGLDVLPHFYELLLAF